jgi:UDP-N-acetylmuramate dehydrogenase
MMEKYPSLPQYNAGAGKTKISGGWLIEKAGFKGKSFDGIKVHNKSALVLINSKNGSFKKLEKAIKIITDGVKNKFDIDLEIEPNLIK